jgi:bifunctional non-homologous end joining protein LigD
MPKRDSLKEYRSKRSADSTPEPFGGVAAVGSGIFVVQKHAARRLHYDLRLELGGVLESWAVPKGVSPDPAEKRLAVKVEDHPLEYADFEGIIPKGNYGAGAVIVWDRGRWVPIEDPEEGLERGKLLFELRGYKLRGVWTLVKLAKGDNEWLLIRERRGLDPSAPIPELPEASIFSGLTIEEVRDGDERAAGLRRALGEAEAPRRNVRPGDVKLMLARSREQPFTKPGWLFELKLDGYRMLASREGGTASLITRNGHDATGTFPDLAHPLSLFPFDGLVLDGEVVVHDEAGHPSFQRLQKRARLSRPLDVKPAALTHPATYWAFDLLAAEGYDLRPLPLEKRKALLRDVLPPVGPFRYLDHFEERGEALYEQVTRMGLEGVVAKKADSRYRGGRSANWLKIRADLTADLIVVGYTEPKGSRAGFGALHLAAYAADGALVYAGRVGTGFSQVQLAEVAERLAGAERDAPPCGGPTPNGKGHHWVDPELVCEVRYREWTEEGLLRHPAFLRFRSDKRPEECELPGIGRADRADSGGAGSDPGAGPAASAAPAVEPVDVKLSNLTKVFWPDEGYTKGDLIDYYRTIAPHLLPYLKDRPLVLTRYPDGIEGKSFYQKDAPVFIPDWIRTEKIWSTDTERDIAYFVCDDLETLLYIINLGTIPLHVWASRVGALERPDWCILDLDPKEAPFSSVIAVAKVIRALCEEIGLPAFVKTSGSSGLHVLVPLAGQFTYEQSRKLGQLMATVVVAERPDIATITRTIAKRGDKVYIDFLQNRRGQLLVAPYSVRPNPGARVSTPLRWREVKSGLDIRKYTIKSVPRRVRAMKSDPVLPVLRTKPDLLSSLHRLSERLETAE